MREAFNAEYQQERKLLASLKSIARPEDGSTPPSFSASTTGASRSKSRRPVTTSQKTTAAE